MTTVQNPPIIEPKTVSARVIRRRVRAERLTYGAITLGVTVAPQIDTLWPSHAAAAATFVGASAWLYGKTKDNDGLGLLRTSQRALPILTGAGLYLGNLVAPGVSWWELAGPAAWGALMGWLAPITRSAGLTLELPAQIDPAAFGTVTPAAAPTTYPGALAHMWDTAGIAPDTQLTNVQQYRPDRPDFEATVVALRGKPVPKLTPTQLAAVFDFPEGSVVIEPIPGSGPGRMALTATPTLEGERQQQADGLRALWEAKVNGPNGAAPGMILTGHRAEPNRIVLRVEAPEGQLINLPQRQLARAFGMTDASLLMVETDGLGDGIVSIYQQHPLLNVREATVEDLTMRADGTIQIGVRHDGRAARVSLYDPAMGAVTDLYAGAPGAGKSVTLLTLLAAERISGVVSVVADAQDGMSLPEADGRVYHFGKGIAATAATLAAFNELGSYREKVSAANGWGSFEIGKPWSLSNGTFDELNRILASDAIVPPEFRKWVSGLVSDGQSTGRKLGKGIRFAAQSIHLADLGDKDKIRANAKNGTVWLGRVNSSTTTHMAKDGVLPPGVDIDPIPRYFKTGSDIDAAFSGQEAINGPITAGMANVIQGGSLFLARTFFARKENKTYPGLIALMESAPIPRPTPDEDQVFQQAYAKWLPYAEALLAGEDSESAPTNFMTAAPMPSAPAPVAPQKTLKSQVLEQLAGGHKSLKELRAALPEAGSTSVSNAITELREKGLVAPVSRGVWQAVTAPGQDPPNEADPQVGELLPAATELVTSTQFGSASMLQRKLRISWDLTNAVMAALEAQNVIGPKGDNGNHPVLTTPEGDRP